MTVPTSQWRSRSLTAWLLAFAMAPAVLSATAFRPTFTASNYLGLAAPVLACEALLIVLALAHGMRPVAALLRLNRWTLFAALVWLCTVTFVAAAVAPFPRIAEILLAATLVHALFALSLADRFSSSWRGREGLFLLAAGWGAAVYCVFTYCLLLAFSNDPRIDWLHLGTGVSNVRQLAFYGLTSAAVGAGMAISGTSATSRSTWWRNPVFVVVGSGLCVWSGGRSGAGALLIVIGLAVACAPQRRRLRLSATLLAALAIGIALSNLWLPTHDFGIMRILGASSIASGDINEFTSDRWQIWQETLKLIAAHPLFGYGLGQFKFVVPSSLHVNTHPHNSLIQFLFQWGLVGTGAVCVMIWPAVRQIASTIRDRCSDAGLTAICLLAGHLSMSLIEGNLFHIYPTAIVVLALVVLRSASCDTRAVRHPSAAVNGG